MLTALSEENHLEAEKSRSGIRKRLQLIKVSIPPVVNHLSWYGAVCSRPCFCVQQQQEFENSGSYKAGASKPSRWTKSHVLNWFVLRGNKQKAVCQSRHFSWQNFVLSSYQALKFADFNIGWCGKCSATVRFCSKTLSNRRRRSRHLL